MRQPLIDRLPPDDPDLARFDASLDDVEFRRTATPFDPETEKDYDRRYRHYRTWCSEATPKRQGDPAFLSTEAITDYTRYMITVKRYMPQTIRQAMRALEVAAERAACNPMPSTLPARSLLDAWIDKLANLGIVPRRRKRGPRRRPTA